MERYDWNAIVDGLNRYLRLRSIPLGMKLFETVEAMEAIPKVKPDLVVLDLNLPDKDGIEVIKDIQALHAGLPVIAVSMNDEALYAPRVLRAGGRGYVTKQEAPEKLVSAIRAVLSGQIAISEKVSARIVEVFSGQKSQTASTPEDQLSDRELEILRHYGEGWSTEEIGAKLHLSPKTVDVHRANIKQKLGLQTTGMTWQLAPGSEAAINYAHDDIAVSNLTMTSGDQRISADGRFGKPGDVLQVTL